MYNKKQWIRSKRRADMQKLTYAQKKIAHTVTIGQSMIKGEAGAGKTTIGIARMLYLLENTGETLLMVLAKKASSDVAKSELSAGKSRENMNLFQSESTFSHGRVCFIEELLELLAKNYFGQQVYIYIEDIPDALLEEAILEVKKGYPRVKSMAHKHLLQEEIKWIYAKGYGAEEAYLAADRTGCTMKWPKRGTTRKAIWALKEYVEMHLERRHQMLISSRDFKLLERVKENGHQEQYKHLIVDDAHLLTEVQLQLLGALRKAAEGEVLFLVDSQVKPSRLLGISRGQSYKKLGYDMTGRVRRINKSKPKTKNKIVKTNAIEPTPLELFMQNQLEGTTMVKSLESGDAAQSLNIASKLSEKKSSLPWYVETYKYIKKLTGIETIFQQDTSAGESYIDEVKQDEVQSLPIYSDIAAGMPIEVVEDACENFELPGELLGYKKNTYMLHVQGDSMTGAGIEDGDYVVIQAGSVSDREIAAVYYNGAITLKRIMQEEDHILLVSENPKYRPIMIEDGEFRAMGKLIGVLKSI